MKRRIGLLVVLAVVVAALVGCASRLERSANEFAMGGAVSESAPMAPAEAPMADSAFVTGEEAVQLGQAQERLIIRTADMTVVVTNTEETMDRIAALAENAGGWVVSSNVYQSTETAKSGYIQIRVPAEGFQSALDAIAALAVEVDSLSTSGQDVTEEYVDLSSQLSNLEATAERVRGFLDEARTTEEALAVNQELSRLEGEIEVIKGRMQYLSQSAAFSSIGVNLTPDELAQPIQVAGWEPTGVAKQAVEALITTLQALASAAIWFVIFALPVLLIIAIPFVLLILLIRWLRRRARRQPAAEPGPPAAE